ERRYAVAQGLHAVERNCLLAAQALGYERRGACDYGLRAGGEPPFAPRSPFALLLTMTSRADKLWPEERWRALAAALAARGLQCVLPWGSDAERLRCERIASGVDGALVPERMPLGALARLMPRAQCVVGVDTGLAHLAAALGARTAGIYCGSDPVLTGLYGSGRARNLGAPGRPPGPQEVLEALEPLA
ncbi:MAG: glycosyltransferase family 9 protein, partial [Pseudomonadota bacterium]